MASKQLVRSGELQVHYEVPVAVCGYKESGIPFEEMTYTVTVSPKGSLIELVTPVMNGQLLLLRNVKTEEKIICHILTHQNSVEGRAHVRVGFTSPSPRFWGLDFPQDDRRSRQLEDSWNIHIVPDSAR